MLSVNIGFNKINFLCIDSTADGPFISFAGSHPISKIEDLDTFISNVLLNDKALLDSINDNIVLSVDTDYLFFNQKFILDEPHSEYSQGLSDSSELEKYYDSYYYPIGSMENQYLGVHINKEIKDKIIKAFSSVGKISILGVGLFSAKVGASKLFGASKESSYMVIKFKMNNYLEALFVDDGLLSSFSKFRFNAKSNKFENKFFFGDQNHYLNIENLLCNLSSESKTKSDFNCKQFIYQSSGKSKIVDSFLSDNNENIIAMNIFDMVRNNDISNTIINGMPYVECSQILRGSDV